MAAVKKLKVSPAWLVQRGQQALNLAREHLDAVQGRLAPAVLEGLEADLEELPERQASARTARQASKVATTEQAVALSATAGVISAVGAAARRHPTFTRDQRKAYGVGLRMNPRTVSSVAALGALIVQRATNQPDEARSLGLLDTDVEQLRELIQSLQAIDAKQEKLLAARPRSTANRNRAAVRIYEAIKQVAAAGTLAFALEPDLRAQFDALDDLPKQQRKGSKKAA